MGLLGSIWVKLGLDNSDFKKGLNESKGKANQFSSAVNKIGGMIAGAFAVESLIRFGQEISGLAAKAEGVERAFKRIATPTTLQELRGATQGMVTDFDLMKNSVKANNFKIPLEQLATYFNFATIRAAETGESVDYLVDSIITGLGRQSVMILDNLGLSAAEIRKQMEGGASMADAVGKIIQQEMGNASEAVSETARQTAQLNVEWDNFKVTSGKVLNEVILPLLTNLNKVLDVAKLIPDKLGSIKIPMSLLGALFDNPKITAATDEVIKYITTIEKAKEVLDDLGRAKYSSRDVNTDRIKKFAEDFINKVEGPLKKTNISGSIANLNTQLDTLKEAYLQAESTALRLDVKKQIIAVQKEIDAKMAEGDAISGLIPKLEAEIKKKEELRNVSNDETAIRKLNEEIAKLQERLNLVKMTIEQKKKYREDKYGAAIPAAPATPAAISGTGVNTQNALDKDIQANQEYYNNLKAQREGAIDDLEKDMEGVFDLGTMFKDTLITSVSGGLEALTKSLVETGRLDVGSVAQALLTPFANMAIQLGEYALAAGFGIEAIKASFETMQGAAAIAAGVALIALGSAIKYGVAAIGKGAGTGTAYGYTTAYMGGTQMATSAQAIKVEVVGKLEGSDIRIAGTNSQINQNR